MTFNPNDGPVTGRDIIAGVLIRVLGLVAGLMVIAACILAGAVIALYLYNATHAIPDPVVRGDDLGNGFAALFGVAGGFVVSIPVSLVTYLILVRNMLNRRGKR